MNLTYLIYILFFSVVTLPNTGLQHNTERSIQVSEVHHAITNSNNNLLADEETLNVYIESCIQSNFMFSGIYNSNSSVITSINTFTCFGNSLNPLQTDIPPPVCS